MELTALRSAAARASGWIRERLFWAALIGSAVVVVLAAAWVGAGARERAAAYEVRADTVREVSGLAGEWLTHFVAPTAAESTAWRRSERAVMELGVGAQDRFGVAQLVAQRAEGLGIADVLVDFVDAGTLEAPPTRSIGPVTLEPAPYALAVRFSADYQGVISFVGALPPQVVVHSLELAEAEASGALDADVVLVVYQGVEG